MNPDFLVIGAGVAGLRAAIELAPAGRVLVIAKESLWESSSEYAQGGVAVALSDEDEVRLHEADTLAAGDGLCDVTAVRILVQEGPAIIQQLIDWGIEFDREGAKLAFGREGAHSRNRILHAHGDSTGREIMRTLYRKAETLPSIEFKPFTSVVDLLVDEDRVTGALLYDSLNDKLIKLYSRSIILATGGLGQVFRETTNPSVATGDGVAVAYRAGADICDMEFIQFHPTALYIPGAPRFLLSEALRGEGAYLVNVHGRRFMPDYHPQAELAPRDVVARSIVTEMRRTSSQCVYLDLRHLDSAYIQKRFPRIYQTCKQFGIDITADLVPVIPAAHYAMGGVRTDLWGRTTLRGLYAAGEVACTGVHGANRLASNSLLEGLVYGARTGLAAREEALPLKPAGTPPDPILFPEIGREELRSLTWSRCGIIRCKESLLAALQALESVRHLEKDHPLTQDYELRNMYIVAALIARSALAREESRGAHYRTDFPYHRPEFQKHSLIRKGCDVSFIPTVAPFEAMVLSDSPSDG